MATPEPQKIKRPEEQGQINPLKEERKAPEILESQEDVQARVGEVIYPKENVPTLSSVRTELDAFRAQQQRVINAIEKDPTFFEKAGAALDHRKIAKSVAAISVAENQNLLNAIKSSAARQDKTDSLKDDVASLEDKEKISKFNQKRVEDYATTIGNGSKEILKGIGHGSAEFLKALGSVALLAIKGTGKATVFLGKKGVELLWAAWYGSWQAYNDYRKSNPRPTEKF